ncbi:MAG: hypothetical protein ACPGUV_08300 [Polyangiales bacterium]
MALACTQAPAGASRDKGRAAGVLAMAGAGPTDVSPAAPSGDNTWPLFKSEGAPFPIWFGKPSSRSVPGRPRSSAAFSVQLEAATHVVQDGVYPPYTAFAGRKMTAAGGGASREGTSLQVHFERLQSAEVEGRNRVQRKVRVYHNSSKAIVLQYRFLEVEGWQRWLGQRPDPTGQSARDCAKPGTDRIVTVFPYVPGSTPLATQRGYEDLLGPEVQHVSALDARPFLLCGVRPSIF